MNVLIVDCNDGDAALDGYIRTYASALGQRGVSIKTRRIGDAAVGQCTGCSACMERTPGDCTVKDGQNEILRDFLGSDVAVIATPLRRGFINATAKRFLDRLFPVELPFLEIRHGRMHHRLRYDKYPKIGFIFGPEMDGDAEEIDINRRYAELVGDYYSGLLFAETTETGWEAMVNETVRSQWIA